MISLKPVTQKKIISHKPTKPVVTYSVNCDATPTDQSFEIHGPAIGLRYELDGHPNFFSFAELAKSLWRPDMNDQDKAIAVYRFSSRYTYSMSIGFGSCEMTRFLNGHGYSFCWGQADFQHLLYEAMGLRVRSPQLAGHSSVEILIDGRWTTWDAYTRNCHPSPDLTSLATGKELKDNPEIIDTCFEPERAKVLKQYWAGWGDGFDSYEPWQDSRIMTLNLRRNEYLSFDLRHGENWCLAPCRPPDIANGNLHWSPILDKNFLDQDIEKAEGVTISEEGLTAEGNATLEFRLHSPWPIISGVINLVGKEQKTLTVYASRDERLTWHEMEYCDDTWTLPPATVSVGKVQTGISPADLDHGAVHSVVIRIEWSEGTLKTLMTNLQLQAHGKSLPRMKEGNNIWKIIGGNEGSEIRHSFTTSPGLTVSDASPLAGEQVRISATVINESKESVSGAVIRFRQDGTDVTLGTVSLDELEPGKTETVGLNWEAAAHADRPGQDEVTRHYVESNIIAELVTDKKIIPLGSTVITVRPRPFPKISSAATCMDKDKTVITVRAALTNMPPEIYTPRSHHLYVTDSPLSATLKLYTNHPDCGGKQVGEPQTLESIFPTEFAVAKWMISSEELPNDAEPWIVVECDNTVKKENQRIVVKIRNSNL